MGLPREMNERIEVSMRPKPREVTSLKVNPDLWKEAKIQAIREGITLGDLLDEAVKDWIDRRKKASK